MRLLGFGRVIFANFCLCRILVVRLRRTFLRVDLEIRSLLGVSKETRFHTVKII